MDIAKNISSDKYLNLDLKSIDSSDWEEAINIMKFRLTERFIEPADRLIEFESLLPAKDKKYGFAVLAIDCLLSETIQAFYEGVTESKNGNSKRLFKNFLTQRDSFKDYFKDDKEAEAFYINFRCGILHQAQTSIDTRIWAIGNLITRSGRFVTVNRELYHSNIKDELDKYVTKLKTKEDTTLLKHFVTKMDFIAGR